MAILKSRANSSVVKPTRCRRSPEALESSKVRLEPRLNQLQATHPQLRYLEKMPSLNWLVSGVVHEINESINFISGNLPFINEYTEKLLQLLQLYRQHYPDSCLEIQAEAEAIDLKFLLQDLPKTLSSTKVATDRILNAALVLQNFGCIDNEEPMKFIELHKNIESILLLLQSRLYLKTNYSSIQIIKEYGNLPLVECCPGQINQILTIILTNLMDALNKSMMLSCSSLSPSHSQRDMTDIEPQIRIDTEVVDDQQVMIRISDNRIEVLKKVCPHSPFPCLQTKPIIGKDLWFSVIYQIVVERHRGMLNYTCIPKQGVEIVIQLPIQQ